MASELDVSFGSDEEVTTAAEILQMMEEAWMNEKNSPDLLPNKMEVVECLYLQLQEMEKNIERLNKNDIRRCAHELELNRIRFMLASYLRVRLLKLETYTQTILEEENMRVQQGQEAYLSDSEKVFVSNFQNLFDKYIEEIFNFIPGYVPDESKEHPIKPNMKSFVFFQTKKAIDGVLLDVTDNNQEDIVDIQDSSKMIMQYSSIEPLLKRGDVRLL